MRKKALIVCSIMFAFFAAVAVRIISLNYGDYTAVSVTNSYKTIDIARIRGTVFDCNLKPFTNCSPVYTAAAKPTASALQQLKTLLDSDMYSTVYGRMQKGNPVTVDIPSMIEESDCVRIIEHYSPRSENLLAQHVIGYSDSAGNGVSGIEKAFNTLLESPCRNISVRFSVDATGKIMLGKEIQVYNNKFVQRNGIVLTLDKDIQKIAENAADALLIDKGAVVITEIENCAIRACVSRPLYDPDRLDESINSPDSPFINRAFSPYSVGSAFKPVVAAAALEQGHTLTATSNCTGASTVNGVTFHCHEENGHGYINLNQAITFSCNTYFIDLALRCEKSKLIETAEGFGFGRSNVFAPGLFSSGGNLPSAQELDSKAAVANLSFGQGSLLATPVQLAAAMACFANGGIYKEPYLIEGTMTDDIGFTPYDNKTNYERVISKKTADTICACLENVIINGTGKRARSDLVTCAGKTATAQTGKSDSDGEIYNSWFVGYFPADNPQYAMAILKEDGGEGAVSCAPVFKKICEDMYNSGYIK
ncbi:MAG: penicillin-binding protein 2 [Clostridia bacterium]|nr:penicillin-binding protein 2 [Clostridia bacterium]